MDLIQTLSSRISMNDIHEILYWAKDDNERKQELYHLLYHENDKVAYQSAWVMTHFSNSENEWLYSRQNELIDEAMDCKHTGKRRLILTLLLKQPMADITRIDFLDFCFERMISKKEPVGVQSLCIKLAYELCHSIPELVQELRIMLEMMDGEMSPAIQAASRNVLKDIRNGEQ